MYRLGMDIYFGGWPLNPVQVGIKKLKSRNSNPEIICVEVFVQQTFTKYLLCPYTTVPKLDKAEDGKQTWFQASPKW